MCKALKCQKKKLIELYGYYFFSLHSPFTLFASSFQFSFFLFLGVLNVYRKELLIYNTAGCNIRLDENKCGRRSPSSSIHSQCFTLLAQILEITSLRSIGQSQVMKNLRISDSLRISVLASQILAASEFCNDCGCRNS